MRPANQRQVEQHMEHLLDRKLKGNRTTKVKEHIKRAKNIASAIWMRFQVGPYQYQLKHLKWYLETQTQHLTANTGYRHWLTVKNIMKALNKGDYWIGQLQGPWTRPTTTKAASDDKG
ncbi:hypothetical protein ACWCIB_02970 [SAR92 clade bacterium H246]